MKKLKLKDYSDSSISFEYLLYSNDQTSNGIVAKVFSGNIVLVKINGSWYIDSQDGELLRSEVIRDSYSSSNRASYTRR